MDVASLVFRDGFGCWGFLDLWRAGASARFSRAEASWLADIAGPVTTAMRRSQAHAFVAGTSAASPRTGPVVLLLSAGLDVLGQTPETQEYLRILVPPDDDRPPVPAGAYNVAAQLLAAEADVDQNRSRHCRHHRADLATDRVALFARAFAFSPRESELAGHLTRGADTAEIARRMFLSEHTVHNHLKSIFAKTSTRSRRALLALTLGG